MFASNQDRLDMIAANPAFGLDFVVRIRTARGESEIFCDGFEHAFDTAHSWKNVHGAEYVEMFRVDQSDGSLYGGIGAF